MCNSFGIKKTLQQYEVVFKTLQEYDMVSKTLQQYDMVSKVLQQYDVVSKSFEQYDCVSTIQFWDHSLFASAKSCYNAQCPSGFRKVIPQCTFVLWHQQDMKRRPCHNVSWPLTTFISVNHISMFIVCYLKSCCLNNTLSQCTLLLAWARFCHKGNCSLASAQQFSNNICAQYSVTICMCFGLEGWI